jgi:inner membrane protease subunit 1
VDPRLEHQKYIRVPEGHAWIIGDNLSHSQDSRRWGPVPLAMIRGKVVGRVYPDPAWF